MLRATKSTCNGARESIRVVKDLVADAPDVKGWQFEAFRQAIPESVALETDTFKLSTDDLKFSYQNMDEDQVDVTIYLDGLNDANREDYTHAAFILFDAAAGELLIMEKVNRLDVRGALESDVNTYNLLEVRHILVH